MAKTIGVTTPELRELSFTEVQALIEAATRIMMGKREARRKELMAELDQLGPGPSARQRKQKAVSDNGRGRRKSAKVKLKYRSKKDPQHGWSGRGMLPRWMRDEMKGTKLRKEDFLI